MQIGLIAQKFATIGARDGEKSHVRGPGSLQRAGAGGRGGAGSEDIVDQQHSLAVETKAAFDSKRALNVGAALGVGEPGLRGGGAASSNDIAHGCLRSASDFVREQIRLIESAMPAAAPVERHRDDEVVALVDRQSAAQERSQGPSQRVNFRKLEQVNQAAHDAFISAERIDGVEAGEAQTAQRAAARVIERRPIQERSAARDAEIIGDRRFGRAQAGIANRNSGNFVERLFADAAVIREDEVEESAESLLRGAYRAYGQIRKTQEFAERATREDPPPRTKLQCTTKVEGTALKMVQ